MISLNVITPVRLYRRVAEQIAALIVSGDLAPGDHLPAERTLAEQLGVSRPTVREAMIALEILGYVEIRSGAGVFVRNDVGASGATRAAQGAGALIVASMEDLGAGPIELLDARLVIEPAVAAAAATHRSEQDLARLDAAIDALAAEADIDARRGSDLDFHVGLAAASGNAVLSVIVDQMWRQMFSPLFERLGTLTGLFLERDYSTLEDHRAIAAAVRARDSAAAHGAVAAHLTNVRRTLLKHDATGGRHVDPAKETRHAHP